MQLFSDKQPQHGWCVFAHPDERVFPIQFEALHHRLDLALGPGPLVRYLWCVLSDEISVCCRRVLTHPLDGLISREAQGSHHILHLRQCPLPAFMPRPRKDGYSLLGSLHSAHQLHLSLPVPNFNCPTISLSRPLSSSFSRPLSPRSSPVFAADTFADACASLSFITSRSVSTAFALAPCRAASVLSNTRPRDSLSAAEKAGSFSQR